MTETAIELNAKDLIAQVPEKSDDELTALLEAEEAQEKPRSTVIDAIIEAQQAREKAAEEAAKGDPTYEPEILIDNSGVILGCNRHTAYGALSTVTEPITKVAARKLVKEFLTTEATTDEETDGE